MPSGAWSKTTLLAHPEVVSVARRTGRAELDEHAQGVEAAELDVSLAMQGRSKEEFLDALRRDFSLIPGMNITIGQPISHRIDHMLSGTRANIAVKIFGEDLYTLRALGEKVRQAMATVPGVSTYRSSSRSTSRSSACGFDRQAMARYGVTVDDVAHTLEAALQGVTVSRILEGRYAFDLVVRQAEAEGWTPETLGNLPVDTPGGAKMPLHALAQVSKTTGPNTISREQVERKDRRDVQCGGPRRGLGRPGYAATRRSHRRRKARLYRELWRAVRERRGGQPSPRPARHRRRPRRSPSSCISPSARRATPCSSW